MRPAAHPTGCHKFHEGCDWQDAWCVKCGTRYSPPDGFNRDNYVCIQCRAAVPA